MDKLILSDLENEMQRGLRAYKIYEKALQAIESLRALEADSRAAEKRKSDADAAATETTKKITATLASLEEEILFARGDVEKSKNQAGEILADAQKKAAEAIQRGIDAAAAEREKYASDIEKANAALKDLRKEQAELSAKSKQAWAEYNSLAASISAFKEERDSLLKKFQ